MVGWHPCLNGHEFEKAPGDAEGQGGLVCCSPWGHKESNTTEQQQQGTERDLSVHACASVASTNHRQHVKVLQLYIQLKKCLMANITGVIIRYTV